MPVGESSHQGFDPFCDPGLAPVDLLTSPDEADDNGPIGMPVEARNQEFRF